MIINRKLDLAPLNASRRDARAPQFMWRPPIWIAAGVIYVVLAAIAFSEPQRKLLIPKAGTDWQVMLAVRGPDEMALQARFQEDGELAVYGNLTGPAIEDSPETTGWGMAKLDDDELSAMLRIAADAVGDFKFHPDPGEFGSNGYEMSLTIRGGGLSIRIRDSFDSIEAAAKSPIGVVVSRLAGGREKLFKPRLPPCFFLVGRPVLP